MSSTRRRRGRVLAPVALGLVVLGACVGGGNDDPQSGAGGTVAVATEPTFGDLDVDANVIAGTVLDEQGDPVAGAELLISGYRQDGSVVGWTDVSGADGGYELEVDRGLYSIRGRHTFAFDGQQFTLGLHPHAGTCGGLDSVDGIQQDFVLRLTGLAACAPGADPGSASAYTGGAITILGASLLPPGGDVEITLTPVGPLADGSTGRTLTFRRSVEDLARTTGPLERTGTLHDIPLGRYEMSGSVRQGTSETPLLFAPGASEPSTEVQPVRFQAVLMEPFGIRPLTFDVAPAGGGSPTPTSDGGSPTTQPATPSTCTSPNVGVIPC